MSGDFIGFLFKSYLIYMGVHVWVEVVSWLGENKALQAKSPQMD